MIPRILSHQASKSVKGFDLCACLREKNKIKKSQESDISPICPEVPRERIFTKLGTNIPFVDIINCDKFCDNLFEGLHFTGGQIPNFPIGIWRRRYTSAALPRSLWLRSFTLGIGSVKRSSVEFFLSPKILIVFDFVHQKSG